MHLRWNLLSIYTFFPLLKFYLSYKDHVSVSTFLPFLVTNLEIFIGFRVWVFFLFLATLPITLPRIVVLCFDAAHARDVHWRRGEV